MKLKFKSVQGSNFSIVAESSDTIASVKSKIQSGHGHQASSQKIIYSGKILADTDTVQSCGVSEKDFLVLMVSKPKAAKTAPAAGSSLPTDASATTVSAPSATTSAASSATTATSTETTSTPAQPAPAAAAPASGAPGTSQFLVGSALEEAVNNIVDMGFEKSEVQKAMRASFNNPERAVEYLMTGIPEHLSQPPQPSTTQEPPVAAQGGAAPTSSTQAAVPSTAPPNPRAGNLFEAAAAAQAQGAGGQGAGSGLQGLQGMEDDGSGRSVVDLGNPDILAQLRQMVQQNPAALNPLVQALAQTNPRLASAMADDPEGVLNILASGAAGGGVGEGGEGEGEGEESLTLPAMDELNPEDRTAVEQIIAMGIPESKAIEAYLMCGRNVEMAVQYYFENPQDFND